MFDPSKINDDSQEWVVYEITPTYRRSRLDLGDGNWVMRTEYLEDEELIALNRQEFDDSATKRFGDGQVVARVPMNVWMKERAPYVKIGDEDHAKWWLDREENKKYRRFRGRIS